MKKLIIIVSAGCIFYTCETMAQTTPNVAEKPKNTAVHKKPKLSPEERAQKAVSKLDEIVQLTAEQKIKIYDMALSRAKSVDAVMEKYKGQPDKKEQAKQEIQQIRKQFREEVKNVLTPEQVEKLKAYHKAHSPKNAGKPEDVIPDVNGQN